MKIFFSYFALLATIVVSAQGTLNEGKTQLNAGIGFSGWGTPIYFGLDYGLGNNITVGGEVSYRSFGNSSFGLYDYTYTIIGISGNGNYHFNEVLDLPKKWDLYGGATLGFYIWNNSYKYKGSGSEPIGYNPSYTGNSGVGFGIQAGARYFFNNNWGINFETGGGSIFGGKIGLTYKFSGGSSKVSKKSGRDTDTTPSSKTTSATTTKTEPKPEPKVEPKPEPKPEVKPKTETKPKTTTKKKKK